MKPMYRNRSFKAVNEDDCSGIGSRGKTVERLREHNSGCGDCGTCGGAKGKGRVRL